jgi:putative hydrolase of the HAD superfamily
VRSFGAVLCDLDGVLRLWDPGAMTTLDRAYGLGDGTLRAAAFAPARLHPAITGLVSDEQWRAGVAQDLAAACGDPERAHELVGRWTAARALADTAVLHALAAVRRSVPVVLVTNATTRLEDDLAALGLTDAVDAVVNTARIGAAKPDPAVYLDAARRAGVPTGRCLFADDTLANVTAAERLGWPVTTTPASRGCSVSSPADRQRPALRPAMLGPWISGRCGAWPGRCVR